LKSSVWTNLRSLAGVASSTPTTVCQTGGPNYQLRKDAVTYNGTGQPPAIGPLRMVHHRT
jgi:hypothetical protein